MEYNENLGEIKQDKSWFKRHWVLATVLIIVVIAIVSGILTFSYSGPGGSYKGPLAESTNSSQLQCPNLSSLAFSGYAALPDTYAPDGSSIKGGDSPTWVVKTVDYSTKNEKIVYSNDQGDGTILCDLGQVSIDSGFHPNRIADNIYCGDYIRPIVLYKLDSNGNIIKDVKTSVDVIFNSKTKAYITTECGTYDTVNAQQN